MKPVGIKRFLRLHNALDHVKYRLGAKASYGTTPSRIRQIDCSGYARYMIYNCGGENLPDGSWNQLDWCQKHLRKLDKYSDVQYAANDESRLFIAFVKPVVVGGRVVKAGHVWFVYCGETYESHGGKGVNKRHWNQLWAKLRGAVAFELPTVP